MTKNKNTKRALLASVMSLLLCVSMLIGSTFAWFTDTATTNVNKIQSGNLDVKLEMSYDSGATWVDAENQTLEFRNKNGSADILWEPGAEFKLPQLRIKNDGNLALKYKVVVSGLTGDMMLADVLDVKVNSNGVGTLTEVMALNEAEIDGMIHGELAASATSDVYEVSLKMQESAGNNYMSKTLSGLSITVYATQDTVEWDSYTDQYDAQATYSDEATIVEGVSVTLHSASATVTIPANTLTAGQVIKLKEATATPSDTVVTVDDTLISAKDLSIVDADGDEITVPDGTYAVTMNIGKDLDESKLALYHNEDKITEFGYDSASGIISFTTDSFSPFTVIYENIGTIDSAAKLVAVRDSINAGDTKAGVVYNVTKDINLKDVEWTSIKEFAGTIDGQGHTISNLNGAALFAEISGNAVVKDLNIDGIEIEGITSKKDHIAGFINIMSDNAKVEGCKISDVTIQWADTVTDCCDGSAGIIAQVNTGTTVSNCVFEDVKVLASGKLKRTGGIFAAVTGTVSNCTVNGVSVVATGSGYTQEAGGFVGDIYAGANISNCVLNNVTVTTEKDAYKTGGFAGLTYGGTIANCSMNDVTMSVANKYSEYGGFIGQHDSRSDTGRLTVEGCSIAEMVMTIKGTYSNWSCSSAGFISGVSGGVDIKNCSVAGEMDAEGATVTVGGFVGSAGSSQNYVCNFTDCKADVNVTVGDNIGGGFVGRVGGCHGTGAAWNVTLNFTNCEADGNVTATGTGTAGGFYGEMLVSTCTFTGCKVDDNAFTYTAATE